MWVSGRVCVVGAGPKVGRLLRELEEAGEFWTPGGGPVCSGPAREGSGVVGRVE